MQLALTDAGVNYNVQGWVTEYTDSAYTTSTNGITWGSVLQFTPVSQAYADSIAPAGDGSGIDRANPVIVDLIPTQDSNASLPRSGLQMRTYISEDGSGNKMLNADIDWILKEADNSYNFLHFGFCFWDEANSTDRDCVIVRADPSSGITSITVEDGKTAGLITAVSDVVLDTDAATADKNVNWELN